ncbi:TIGR03746 family integrating conjugative element protein [Pseudomonas cichorii]|uniref:PFL_4703 family integrating conjugative element protein n=1 Tax=Pseudomonas cichorii TaxID=36746 RepID=UPI0018E65526|nr:TIGR03746 family integrating conjugative element protein [Pseudomonas cichorii]MBI6855542.1 TIGR03746 family integrating conjugative element protein [Pseudomonas cichorii]
MSRFWKQTEAQRAHILSLRIALILTGSISLVLAYGWWSAPKDLNVHVPPDLRSGSTRKWWDVPPESVYTFGFYIFQQINRWPVDGEADYERNLFALASYLTPSCAAYLQRDFEVRRNSGELRRRVRGVYEIPGSGYGDAPTLRVVQLSLNDWTVNLDITADEYLGGERVKRALARYPLHIIRQDFDPEKNPFGLAWDCYSGTPQRIEAPDLPGIQGEAK